MNAPNPPTLYAVWASGDSSEEPVLFGAEVLKVTPKQYRIETPDRTGPTPFGWSSRVKRGQYATDRVGAVAVFLRSQRRSHAWLLAMVKLDEARIAWAEARLAEESAI